MGLITTLALLAGSALFVGGRAFISENAKLQLDAEQRYRGTDYARQLEVKHLSYGDTEANREEFRRLLGDDYCFKFDFDLSPPSERELAVWWISRKEGWIYTKQCFTPEWCWCYDPARKTTNDKLFKRL